MSNFFLRKVNDLNVSGIYKIVNLVNGKYYIGSSVNILSRWSGHRRKLRRGLHENQHLQSSYTKYGEKSFQIFVIEKVANKESLKSVEQKFLDIALLEKEIVYNSKFTAYETNWDSINQSKGKITGVNHKKYDRRIFSFSRGVVKFIGTRNQFRLYSSINDGHIFNLINGYRESCEGWVCDGAYEKKFKIAKERPLGYKVTYGDGTFKYFYHLKTFCLDNDLNYKYCSSMVGKLESRYKGLRIEYVWREEQDLETISLFQSLRDNHLLTTERKSTDIKKLHSSRVWKLRNNYKSLYVACELTRLRRSLIKFVKRRTKYSKEIIIHLLGCSILEFKTFLTSNLPSGISWEDSKSKNFGLRLKENPQEKWDSNKCDEKYFHYSNFELGPKKIKGSKHNNLKY